jgi:hypothetical protein
MAAIRSPIIRCALLFMITRMAFSVAPVIPKSDSLTFGLGPVEMGASLMTADSAEGNPDFSRYPTVISIAEARQITGLDLLSARDLQSVDGRSYQEMEEQSESKSHQSAKKHGITYFLSIGYEVFPDGVGVRGTNTLADFLAVRKDRIVFVEVLSDTNISDITFTRKGQLQKFGELCFILFSGTKRSTEESLLAAKRAAEAWADVLYFRLDGYGGSFIDPTYRATIAYQTTRARGIRTALSLAQRGRAVSVSIRFLTHLYDCVGTPMYHPVPVRKRYEEIFLKILRKVAYERGEIVKLTTGPPDVTAFRAMRRSSGIRMVNSAGQVTARLKSEYRGAPVRDKHVWDEAFATFDTTLRLRGLSSCCKDHPYSPQADNSRDR